MLLVDTSVWVDHLRKADAALVRQLELGQVCAHPMVIGELACGHLQNRSQLLSLLEALPKAREASHNEALYFLDAHALAGKGIGWVDVHLLASSALSPDCLLWTRDRRLLAVAQALKLSPLVS